MRDAGIIARYREHLPVTESTPIISLDEGSTPLIRAPRLAADIHKRIDLYLKYEGLNPTGSFKDRGMTLAITKAVEDKYRAVMCASTGNTSAAAAAYAARAGIKSIVLIPEGKIAMGKLSQAMIHGGIVVQIRGNFDDALRLARSICDTQPIALVNSVNEYRLEGQKTGAFEIVDAMEGAAPDFHCLPVGNAGNISAYWRGYKEYAHTGKSRNLPRMIGFQAAGAAPIVLGHPVDAPQTFATAIRIGNPASWELALQARDESGGLIGMVTDRQIKNAYGRMAQLEGLFAEPASAAGIAGLYKLAENGFFDSLEGFGGQSIRIVSVLTGHGLKDPQSAIAQAEQPATVDATEEAVLEAIESQSESLAAIP